MSSDILFIILSYTNWEDFLKVLKNRSDDIEKFLKIYPREIPSYLQAIDYGPETIRYLIRLQIDPPADVILYATRNGYLDILQSLVNYITYYPHSLLRIAISRNHLHIVKFLIQYDSKIFGVKKETVEISYISGHLRICEYFFSLGYLPERSILDYLSSDIHIPVIKFLRSLAGYELEVRHLEKAIIHEQKLLVSYLVGLKIFDLTNSVFLKLAIELGYLEIVKILVKYIKLQYEHLQCAIYEGKKEIIEYIISKGIQPKPFDLILILEL